MVWQVTITDEAWNQLRALSVREQRMLEAAVGSRLRNHPTSPSKAIKQLRPNPFAEYELRVGDLRVLYNVEVDRSEVVLLLVGRKVGNTLIVGSEVFRGHQANPPE